MSEEEKMKAKAEEKAKETKRSEEKVEDLDQIVLETIKATYPDYSKLRAMLPSFRTMYGDLISGVELLDPKEPAQRNLFLTKTEYKDRRAQLLRRLQMWKEYLSADKAIDFVRQDLHGQAEKLDKNLELNLRTIHKATRELETTYRAVDKFFSNAKIEPDDAVDVWFSNIALENLADPDDKSRFERVSKEVADRFREFSIRECFSLCVLPGFLGDVQKIDTFAHQLGLPNKLHIISDLPNFGAFENVMEFLNDPIYANLAGNEDYKQYFSLCANYILARPRNDYEDEDIWIPPSAVLAGRMYRTDDETGIHQSVAGKHYGKAADVTNVRFRVNEVEAGALTEKSVIPTTLWDGNVHFMGDTTLFKGENFGIYSVRRTFDYVYKNVRQYLNTELFEKIDEQKIGDIKKNLNRFLERQVSKAGILRDFKLDVVSDEAMRLRQEVMVTIELDPHFGVKTFIVFMPKYNPEKKRTEVKDLSGA